MVAIKRKDVNFMDKLQEEIKEKANEESAAPGGLKAIIEGIKSTDRRALTYDVMLFAVGFLLSRCHLIFGARPLGIAFVAMLPFGVWSAVSGAAVGALTLGIDGIIFAACAVITALLRAGVSAADRDEDGNRRLFGESLLSRMAAAVLSGFAAAAYKVIAVGLNESSLLYGLTMIISPPLLCFALSGLVSTGISGEALLFGEGNPFVIQDKRGNERYDPIFFQISALAIIFFIGLSFKGVSILGISVTYIFATVITLIAARRFGGLRAAAVGFAASLSSSAELSVAFALGGLGAGIMMSFGIGYGVIIGGVALGAWSAYAGEMTGLLSTLPEYLIGSAIAIPMLKRASARPAEEERVKKESSLEDAEGMVGTMALSYQNRYNGSVNSLPRVMTDLGRLVDQRIGGGEEYRLFCALLEEAMARDEEERRVDGSLTAPLSKVFEEYGFENGSIRAFGRRKKHFILAGEDDSGKQISSFELRKSIEAAADVRLATPEYFRRGSMVLMECAIRPRLEAEFAIATRAGRSSETSGDSAVCFRSGEDYFYSLISDGMGSGEVAKETSTLVADFIQSGMELGGGGESVLRLLNRALTSREEECSATVDLFELDLMNGGGLFLKSGAAPSYVKRGPSIFRIRSHTAPIGLLSSIDTERIRLKICAGDMIIMLSDGICDSAEDAPWLLLLLGDQAPEDLRKYADNILSEATKNTTAGDDMTVVVIRISEAR